MGLLRYALLVAAGCMVLMLAGGCDNTGKQNAGGQPGTAASTASSGAAQAPADTAGADEVDDAGAAAVADGASGGAEEDGAGEVVYYREVNVDFTFLKADFNPDPEATMSLLRFLFEARLARGVDVDQEIELSAYDEMTSAELDLHHSRVEIIPIVAKPRLTDEGPLGEHSYRFDGMYRVNLFLPDGTLCGVFAVNGEGELMTAPPEEKPAGFNATSRMTRDQYGPRKYQVYRDLTEGETTEILYTVYFRGGGFQTLQVISPDQDIYEYRFPEGRLTVRKGAEEREERPEPRDADKEWKERLSGD